MSQLLVMIPRFQRISACCTLLDGDLPYRHKTQQLLDHYMGREQVVQRTETPSEGLECSYHSYSSLATPSLLERNVMSWTAFAPLLI
jgi:hypothetical protein